VNINGNEKSEFYSIQLQCHSTSHSTQPNPWMDPTHVHLCLITPPTSPDRGAEYCDERVCLSLCVCLSVSDHICGATPPIFTNFLCMLSMAVASRYLHQRIQKYHRLQEMSDGVVMCYVLTGLWMTSYLRIS